VLVWGIAAAFEPGYVAAAHVEQSIAARLVAFVYSGVLEMQVLEERMGER